jgi:SAM-dependent methyltransferase
MQTDPIEQFKASQRESWALFIPFEFATTPTAAKLVHFSRLRPGETVLDVGCGTGVVAISAARAGATVKGLDLTPALLERARFNAKTAEVEIEFTEGDVEALPYSDATFDCVLSQFGHMFGPRPNIAIAQMLRVLKPGGTIAFSTWPPEMFIGRMFALVGKYLPPPPPGVAPTPQWGDPQIIRERLGDAVEEILFEREVMLLPALSPKNLRTFNEQSAGPVIKVVQMLKDDPVKLKSFRDEFESLASLYMSDNTIRQHYLMTHARKKG